MAKATSTRAIPGKAAEGSRPAGSSALVPAKSVNRLPGQKAMATNVAGAAGGPGVTVNSRPS